jgi:MFS family permease
MAYGRNILLLCALILLSSIATNLIGPFLSLYIVNSLGASVTELGLVMAVSNAVTAMLLIPSGTLSDKYGRKKLHALGTFLAIFPPLLYTFAIHWFEVVPWLILSGVSLGLYMPIRWSIPADVSTVEKRAMTYSWTNVALLTGSTAGPVLGGLIAEAFDIKTPFLVCFSLLSIAFLLTLTLQETGKRKEPDQQTKHLSDEPPKAMRFSEVITLVSLINILQGAAVGLFFTPLSVFVVQRFSASDALVGLLYAVGFGLASVVVQLPGGRLANCYDRKRLILITFLVSAPFYGLFALSQGLVELFLFMFLANAVLNMGWPASQTLMMDLTPSAKWGLMNGVAGTTFWVGMMAGSAASGILWDSLGMRFPFYVSVVAALLSAIPVLFLKETKGQKT